MVSNEIEEFIEYGMDPISSGGYLVCNKCQGYYQLQEGESPADFDLCECGGSLSYFADLEDVPEYKSTFKSYEYSETPESTFVDGKKVDYDDMQRIIVNLKNKAEKRKELFEELSKKVEIHEELLNEIKAGKWSLMDGIAQKNLEKGVTEERKILGDIRDQERIALLDEDDLIDTMMSEEAKLMAQIREKRSKIRKSDKWNVTSFNTPSKDSRWESDNLGVRMNLVRVILLIIIILILIGFVYLFFVFVLS